MVNTCVWCTISTSAVQRCGMYLTKYTIVYEHDKWRRVDSTWQHVHMQIFCMWDQGSEVDVLVHTKFRQRCACYRAAMINDRTYKESKAASRALAHKFICQCSHTLQALRQSGNCCSMLWVHRHWARPVEGQVV